MHLALRDLPAAPVTSCFSGLGPFGATNPLGPGGQDKGPFSLFICPAFRYIASLSPFGGRSETTAAFSPLGIYCDVNRSTTNSNPPTARWLRTSSAITPTRLSSWWASRRAQTWWCRTAAVRRRAATPSARPCPSATCTISCQVGRVLPPTRCSPGLAGALVLTNCLRRRASGRGLPCLIYPGPQHTHLPPCFTRTAIVPITVNVLLVPFCVPQRCTITH